jgi:hypothetical protein
LVVDDNSLGSVNTGGFNESLDLNQLIFSVIFRFKLLEEKQLRRIKRSLNLLEEKSLHFMQL